jgi:hypothetical protein
LAPTSYGSPAEWLEIAQDLSTPERRLDGYIDSIAAADQDPGTGLQTSALSINGLLFGLLGQSILDHTMLLYLPSADVVIRDASLDGLLPAA